MAVGYQGGNDTILSSFFGGINNAFARNASRLAKENEAKAKQQAADAKELSTLIKEVNTDGVQKQDIPKVSTKLDEVYQKYYDAGKATNREQKLALRMDLERKITELGNFVSTSKQRGVAQAGLANWIGDPNNLGLVSADALQKFKENGLKPTDELAPDAFEKTAYTQPDTSYIDKKIDASLKDLMLGADSTVKVGGRVGIGNQMATRIYNNKGVTPESFTKDLLKQYNTDLRMKNTVDYVAKQMQMTPEDYLFGVVNEYDKAGKLKVSKELSPVNDRAPRAAKGTDEGDLGLNSGVLKNYAITYGTTSDGGKDSPNSALTASSFAHLPSSKVTLAGTYNIINAQDGSAVKIPNTATDFKRVGYGYFPVAAKDFKSSSGKTIKKGMPLTQTFADKNPTLVSKAPKVVVQVDNSIGRLKSKTNYLVDPREAIAISKMTKNEKKVLNAVDTEEQASGTPVRNTVTKETKTSKAPALKKGGLNDL